MLTRLVISVYLLTASFATHVAIADETQSSSEQSESSVTATSKVSPEASAGKETATTTAASTASTTDVTKDAFAAEKWTLRYKFSPDQKLRYKNTEGITLDAMQGEIRKTDVTNFEQRRVFTVGSVDKAGAANLTMQFEFVRMQRQTNDFPPVAFDTTMEAKDIPAEFKNTARDLKRSAPQFWISSIGAALQKSEATEGYELAEKTVAQAGNVIVGDKPKTVAHSEVKQAVGESISSEKDSTETKEAAAASSETKNVAPGSSNAVTFLMPLPEQPVGLNETWSETIPVNVRVTQEISRTINILRTFRLETVENGVATISFRSSVEAAVKSPTMRAQLIKATPKGSLTLDIERGVMLSREIRYDETVLNAIGQNSVVLCNGSSTEVLMDSAD